MVYEFRCDPCGEMFQEDQSPHQEHRADCPRCGLGARRLWSSFSFVVDFRPGFDMGLGEYCDTKKDRSESVARNNLRRIRS